MALMDKLTLKYLKIIIVEDDPHQLKLMRMYFDEHTIHDVSYAETPTRALEIVKKDDPGTYDLALIDFKLSAEMNGLDVARELNIFDKRIIIVIMTANKDEETMKNIFAADNIHSVVDKWKDMEALDNLLDQILSQKEKERRGEDSIFSH